MPLFSKNVHGTADPYGAGTTHGGAGTTHGVGTGAHHGVGTGAHHGVGTGAHHGAGTHHYGAADAYEGMGGHPAEPYGENVGHHHQQPAHGYQHEPATVGYDHEPATRGYHQEPAAGTGHAYGTGVGAPPRTTGAGMGARGSGAGHETMGKMEHALGTLLSSRTLQARGLEKEQEGRTMKELGEADRMEEAAQVRRERALARGPAPGAGRTGGY